MNSHPAPRGEPVSLDRSDRQQHLSAARTRAGPRRRGCRRRGAPRCGGGGARGRGARGDPDHALATRITSTGFRRLRSAGRPRVSCGSEAGGWSRPGGRRAAPADPHAGTLAGSSLLLRRVRGGRVLRRHRAHRRDDRDSRRPRRRPAAVPGLVAPRARKLAPRRLLPGHGPIIDRPDGDHRRLPAASRTARGADRRGSGRGRDDAGCHRRECLR